MQISEMQRKIEKKSFLSEILVSELLAVELSFLRREYLSPAVNVSTNSVKILHSTKRAFFELNCLQIDQ